VVVLDLGLPDIDGIDVITGMRGWTQVPIIVLSGRADPTNKIEALDAGADDYVTKPFNMDELLARIRAALRHQATTGVGNLISLGDYTIDLSAHRITRRISAPTGVGQPPALLRSPPTVHLTPTEWKVLALLLRHPGALVESQRLLTEISGSPYRTETDSLRFHIAGLRRKLEPDPVHPPVPAHRSRSGLPLPAIIDPDPPAVCLTTDTVLAYQLPGWPAGHAHVRVFTPTHRYQRPVIIIGEPVDNPGPPIVTVITKVIEMVRADFLPYHHRAPRVLAYHPDPKGTGWFSTVRMRR
jgi:two-component system KDP operon response regulator KdpE